MMIAKVLETCEGRLFEDPEFPANARSLGKSMEVTWLRPSEFGYSDGELFSDGISPNDIEQGALGDCFFLSSLSVLADEAPWCIHALFAQHTTNKSGVYAVTFHLDGVIRTILVDDRIPCSPATKRPLFARNKGSELWVCIVEKAYAKAYGSYRSIEAGSPGDALADLTGAPVHVLRSADVGSEIVWKRLVRAHCARHVMAAGVPNFAQRELQQEVGLVEGHAYAILDVNDESSERILKLRNPWGRTEWKGAWSDGDTAHWTPELRQRLGFTNADDGTFWMAVNDFVKYFDQVTLLLVDQNWSFTSCVCELSAPRMAFSLEVAEPTELCLTMCQRRGKDTASMRLCVIEEATLKPLGGTSDVFTQSETLSSQQLSIEPGCNGDISAGFFVKDGKFLCRKCNLAPPPVATPPTVDADPAPSAPPAPKPTASKSASTTRVPLWKRETTRKPPVVPVKKLTTTSTTTTTRRIKATTPTPTTSVVAVAAAAAPKKVPTKKAPTRVTKTKTSTKVSAKQKPKVEEESEQIPVTVEQAPDAMGKKDKC